MAGNNVFKKQEKSLGELMIQAGFITKEQLDEALFEQKTSATSAPLGKILVRKGFAREDDIINILKGLLVIIFELNGERFGIEIIYTKEIIRYREPTPIPAILPYMKGMIPLRDKVVPVLSLNKRVSGADDKITDESRIIVIEAKKEMLGIIVDSVLSVKNFQASDFEDINKYSLSVERKFIAGLLKDENEVVTLVKPEILFERER